MRILITADTVGGVFTYATELIAALAPHGVEFHLATQGRKLSDDQRAVLDGLANCEVYESEFKLEWMEDPWSDVARATSWLRELASWVQPDLIHFNEYSHAGARWSSPTLVVGHSCVASWFEAVKGEELPPSWSTYAELVTRGLHRADAVVAPSATMLTALERHYGTLRRRLVIENGRAASVRAPVRAEPVEARSQPGEACVLLEPAETKEPFILAAGRLWDEAKNLAALDAVAPRLGWPVYLAGEGGKGTTGHGGARQLGRLSFDELSRWYARAGLYVFPARYEPFGLSILEAALSGCALVLGDIPSLRELWSGCAVFVHPEDREGLVREVEALIADPVRRATLACAAVERARQFTPERMARRYLTLYEQLIAERTTGADACAW